uniref:Uncharacterized protein AlNc14C384G11247 n=1 Tax=Albugo laibachii Nc14 TaxID=890382 RepID=F0WYI5_9STRA|nr:conserved hypothetical protein [Albugo laibachii Nc14]|eukprot:CCA26542.1 conserved hypothetical protein [Albugo laibachii Nc14]
MSIQQEKELLESLNQKLQAISVHRQNNALEGKKIDEKIRIAFKNPPKRPKITLEKIDMDMETLELRRTTTSMSLNDEKTILREIQSLKEKRKQLEICTAFQETIDALKRTRAERMKQHDVYTHERDQIELQMKRIALAQRLHVPSCEFVTIEVSITEDKIGKSLSKKSLRIDEIQSKCHVLLEFHPTKPVLTVCGAPGNAHLAMEHIEDVTLASTHTFGLHPDTIQLLLIQKCKNLHALEQTHGVRLHLNRVEGVLTLHASPARLQQVQKSIEELNQLTKEISIPVDIVPQLIGKKGETINRLMEDTEALVLIDNVSNVVRLCGTHENVMRAHAFVTELIREKTKTERFFEANDANVFPTMKDEHEFAFFAAFLVSEKGKELRMLRVNASEARIKVLRDEQRIQVNGTRAQIAEVETALRDRFRAFDAQHWTHKVTDPHHISLIVGKNGSMIKQIEESCQGMVRFDTHKQHICVFGESRDIMERAKSQILDIIDRNQRSVYMTSFHIAVLLLGNKRLKLIELEKATECRISIQMPSDRETSAKHTLPIKLVLQGSSIAILAAKNALQSLENDHTVFYLPLDADEIATIVGKKGETISQIAESTGARLHVIREAQAQVGAELEIIGTEHQVASARRQIDEILQTHHQKVLHLDSLSTACLIGKKGERIKSLREEHPATTVTVSAKLGHVRVKAHAAEPLEACVNAILHVLETIQTETVSISDGSNRDFMSILQAHPSIPSSLAELEARGGTSMKVSIMENGKIAKIRGPVRGITKLKDYLLMLSSKDAFFTERVKLPSCAFSSTLFDTLEPTSMECALNENALRIVRQTDCELRVKKTCKDRPEILIEGTQLHQVYVAKQSVEKVLAFYHPKCFRILEKLPHDFVAQLYAKLPQLAIDDAVELTLIDPSSLRIFADTEKNVQLAARTILTELENWENQNLKLTIPNWLVPILLGKNGDTIRALSKEIGARLELDTLSKKAADCNVGVVSRVRDPILTITADDESCAKAAARRILDFQTTHETHTARIGVAKDMIGMIPLLRKKVKNCQIHTLEAPDQAKQVDLLLYSMDPATRQEALKMITSLAADFLATTIDLSASLHSSTAVSGIIGALIGKNGSNIKVLQSEFPNVFVEVHREHHQISIKGAHGDVLKVRTIVEDKVSELVQSRSDHSPAAFHPESYIENGNEAVVPPTEKDVTAHDPNAADMKTQTPVIPIGGSLATSNKLDKNQRRRMRRRAENEMKTAATDL